MFRARRKVEPLINYQFTFTYNSDTTISFFQQWRPDCNSNYETVNTVSQGWGSLSRMVTPLGARVDYGYTNDDTHSLALNPDNAARESLASKTIRRDNDGTLLGTWTYATGLNGGGVTNPDGSFVTETMYPYDRAFAQVNNGFDGKEGLVYRTNNSGKVLIERHWTLMKFSSGENVAPGAGTFVTFNPVVDAEYTSLLENGQPVKMSAKTFQYDHNGNLIEEKCYDWFDPGPVTRDQQGVPMSVPGSATLLRTTTNAFHYDAIAPGAPDIYAKRAIATGAPLILNTIKETITGPSKTRFTYDDLGYGTPPIKGNLTQVSNWDDQAGTFHTTTHVYNTSGNLTSTADPNGHTTLFYYDDATQVSPTRIVVDPDNGMGQQTTTFVYDSSTGLVKSQTDPNGKTTTIDYGNHLLGGMIDPFARPGTTIGPAVTSVANGVIYTNQQQRVKTHYFDQARRVVVETDLNQGDDKKLKSRTTVDELGRAILTERNEDGTDNYTISAQTVYIQMGLITLTSNPKRSAAAPTDGWTRTTRDTLGRVTQVAAFSTASQPPTTGTNSNWTGSVASSYYAHQTTVTDQANKTRRSETDGLGRLKQVIEDLNGLNYETNYTYDTLGNLRRVQQGTQSRHFAYDSLSRLIYARNPEQGVNAAFNYTDTSVTPSHNQWSMKYTYYANGNLNTRTDACNTTATYTYDKLNRNTGITYTGGVTTPSVKRYYDTETPPTGLPGGFNRGDAKGRLIAVTYNNSIEGSYYGYDALGRVQQSIQRTQGQDYTFTYAYDLAGHLTEQTYPSLRKVVTNYDLAGRLNEVELPGKNWSYVSQYNYAAHGAPTTMKLGNALREQMAFNSRLQLTEIKLGTDTTSDSIFKLNYLYGTVNNPNDPDYMIAATQNNGNIGRIKYTIGGVLQYSQTYQYDGVNRLSYGVEHNQGMPSSPAWWQKFAYDQWGNRGMDVPNSSPLVTQGGQALQLADFSGASNRITRSGYTTQNCTGNLTAEPANNSVMPVIPAKSYSYDGENRVLTAVVGGATTNYIYDGEGRRVKKLTGGVTTVFVYNAAGQLIAEYNDAALSPVIGGTKYVTADHLGSTRAVTSGGFGTVKARYDYLPFGEELAAGIGIRTAGPSGLGYSPSPDQLRQKFDGYARDSETGLDFAGARYYGGVMGRFTSPDDFWKDTQLADPQSWNKYAFVRNNPLTYIDPTGEKATVTITVNQDDKTAAIVVSASLVVYAGDKNISQKKLQQTADRIKKQIESTYSGSYTENGITYTLSANINVQVASQDKANELGSKGEVDNLVGVFSGDIIGFHDALNNGEMISAEAAMFRVEGEAFDRMAVAANSDVGKGIVNGFPHEFGHGMGVEHLPPGTVMTRTPGALDAPSRLTQQDFSALFGSAIMTDRAINSGSFARARNPKAPPASTTVTRRAYYVYPN
jgi:RHS repeat-associated protein